MQVSQRLVRVTAKLVAVAAIILLTILFLDAWRSRDRLQTSIWQERTPGPDFTARDARRGVDFAGYLEQENELFTELEQFFVPRGSHSRLVRYVDGGPCDPRRQEPNWNRSIELRPDGEVRGGALLLHGLTDSPYSLHALAELLVDRGFYVLALRLPGHGTVPAALLEVSWKDWAAATEIAATHVRANTPDGAPFYVAGFSMGGALAVHHAVDAAGADPATTPDRVFLFSPAIGITPFARVSNIHALVSWIPYFHDYRWLSVEPEYDLYKYASFPKNAGRQMWLLTDAVERSLVDAESRNLQLPPMMTFQSIVDETVVPRQIHERLYDRHGGDGWELIIFDVNRLADLDEFLWQPARQTIESLQASQHPYRLTVVTNQVESAARVEAHTKPGGGDEVVTEQLDLQWPSTLFSLSHVAIPFAPEDPVYGLDANTTLPLGRLALRGERNVLRISPGQMLRIRSNPFHAYMMRRIADAVDADLLAAEDEQPR